MFNNSLISNNIEIIFFSNKNNKSKLKFPQKNRKNKIKMYNISPSDFPNCEEENSEGYLKLFVGGLNYISMQADIKSYFETFGPVSSCSLLTDKQTGKSRCFAFVSIEDPDSSLQKKILSRKHEINGKIVDVKLAVEGKKREEMLDSSKKIFVGGLEPSVNNDDLREFFSQFGPVREACVLFDNNRGASRCFGFVTFEKRETVELLLQKNSYSIKGKTVDVKQALPKSMQKVQNIKYQSGGEDVVKHTGNKNGNGFMRETGEDDLKMNEMFNYKGHY